MLWTYDRKFDLIHLKNEQYNRHVHSATYVPNYVSILPTEFERPLLDYKTEYKDCTITIFLLSPKFLLNPLTDDTLCSTSYTTPGGSGAKG